MIYRLGLGSMQPIGACWLELGNRHLWFPVANWTGFRV